MILIVIFQICLKFSRWFFLPVKEPFELARSIVSQVS